MCLLEWDEGEPCNDDDDDEERTRREYFYHYDEEEGECVGDRAHGCGGNGNRFHGPLTVWRCVTHRVRKGRVEGGRGEGQGEGEGGGREERGGGIEREKWSKLKSKCVQMLFSILYMYIGNYCLLHVYIHVYIHVYTIICM